MKIFLILAALLMVVSTAHADINYKKDGCSKVIDTKPACGMLNGSDKFQKCVNFYAKGTGNKLAKEFKELSVPLAVRYQVGRPAVDWETVAKGWHKLLQKLDGDEADVVVWLVTSPYHSNQGDYNPDAFLFGKGAMDSFSPEWVVTTLDGSLKNKMVINPIYGSFLHYFFMGDADEMYAFVKLFHKDWAEVRMKNEQRCKNL